MPDYQAHVHTIDWIDESKILWLADEDLGIADWLGDLERPRQDLVEPGQTVLTGLSGRTAEGGRR